ncbi:SIS domain-containing protein [Nitrosopumilus sp.]|uniref:SIS domain-containing protein n=1 Tax=Nitrosopumilus sp. TaxID=2024843 RepID=UPI0026334D75|nr:SIS domain-containing protein [Nitrosopumilus sp.]
MMMNLVNTITAFEKDMELQISLLKSFKKQKPISKNNQKNTIFSGSGDSLVSSMMAESLSDGLVRAMDPMDLYRNKSLVKSKNVYFVSISGNTITNIKTACHAKHSTAITAKPDSRLASATNNTIILNAETHHVFTAGSISFLESALTCMSLVKNIKIPRNSKLFSKAKRDSQNHLVSKKIYVLGSRFTFPLAMYCAAKFYEIMGYDAHYCKIEQFSHMELFSAKKGDTVIVFEEKNPHNSQLVKNLKKVGMNVIHPSIPTEKMSQFLYCTFFSQFLALNEAKRKHRRDCYFVTATKLRNVSNQMIY